MIDSIKGNLSPVGLEEEFQRIGGNPFEVELGQVIGQCLVNGPGRFTDNDSFNRETSVGDFGDHLPVVFQGILTFELYGGLRQFSQDRTDYALMHAILTTYFAKSVARSSISQK